MSEVLKAVSNDIREAMVKLILANGGVSGKELRVLLYEEVGEEGLSESFWFHLGVLRAAGVVEGRRAVEESGRPMRLTVNREVVRGEMERLMGELEMGG